MWKKSNNMSIHLDAMPALDKQTELFEQYCTLHALHVDMR